MKGKSRLREAAGGRGEGGGRPWVEKEEGEDRDRGGRGGDA